MLAGALVLWGPTNLLRLAMLPGNSIWSGLLVGALILVMGVIQLLAPSYALITGAIAIVLSLISLIVALGGFGIGMLLGIIGGSLGVAWKPVVGPRISSYAHISPSAQTNERKSKAGFSRFYQTMKDRSKTAWNNFMEKSQIFRNKRRP